MKWATILLPVLLYIPATAQQMQLPSTHDAVSIRATISGLSSTTMCSAELRSAFTGFVLQRVSCGPAGFEFTDIPRGNYLVVVDAGMKQIEQQVAADVPNTEIEIRLPEIKEAPTVGGSSTVSVAELMIPEKARSLFNEASSLLRDSKIDKAQEKLHEALAIAPQYPRAMALQAVIWTQNNNLGAAMKAADSAVAHDAQLPFAQFVRAMVLNASGRFKEAVAAANQGLLLDGASWQGHFELAYAFYGLGSLSNALQEVNKAQTVAPKNFRDVHLLKAMILLKSNLLEQAQREIADLRKDGHDPRVQQLDAVLAQKLAQR
ncbi:MAG: tetratricopeptide repeat protein [Terriglobales bacterium]